MRSESHEGLSADHLAQRAENPRYRGGTTSAQTFRRGRALAFLELLRVKERTLRQQIGKSEYQAIQQIISGELKAIEEVINEFIHAFELYEASNENL